MKFIQAIQNDQDFVTDAEVEKFLEELEAALPKTYTALEWAAMEGGNEIDEPEVNDVLDEDAWERIEGRVSVRDMAHYRFLVGPKNIMKTKIFLDLALKGKSVPAGFVEGFLPALELLDDIVTAGPAYVQMLKVLQKRAKKQK